jgi:multiple sugar transport system substrate-binding protein
MMLSRLTKLAFAASLLLTAAAGATTAAIAADPLGVDDGTHITLWTRVITQARADALVQAYNASHKNHVDVTYVPTDEYQTKIGAAAAANALPDLFSADVVFMPNWTSAGLFMDLTDRITAMPNIDKVAQAAIKSSTWDGKKYGMPFVVDLSVWMWNKKLFKAAGLDPDKAPANLNEYAADARAVAKLGNGVAGTFFPVSCGGCTLFTWWPISWADGQQVINEDGTKSLNNSDEMKKVFALFRGLVEDGTALMPESKTEQGPTWLSYFAAGKVGIQAYPASLTGVANDNLKDEDIGVAPIAGFSGNQSTFVGGDAIGISKNSKVADAAWNFISWIQSDDAQVEVVAKGGNVLSRSDLANNKYSAKDPRLVIFNQVAAKGETPLAKNFGQSFNDPQGPWTTLLQDAIFGDASKIDADNDAINESLSQ